MIVALEELGLLAPVGVLIGVVVGLALTIIFTGEDR